METTEMIPPMPQLTAMMEDIDALGQEIKQDPLAFYSQIGVEYILAMKELQVFGTMLLRSANVQREVVAILRAIPTQK